ncbi:hypothetical protein ACGFRG_00655 [Streptomyces sp. NPDC048696]|uniref:hypothetical protein n=1 Tax=Streptomyces sp. NPDC048696 TaxID=3365585 RepID=UPI00371D3937
MDGFARVRQAEREHVAGHQLVGQAHGHVTEVDLRVIVWRSSRGASRSVRSISSITGFVRIQRKSGAAAASSGTSARPMPDRLVRLDLGHLR